MTNVSNVGSLGCNYNHPPKVDSDKKPIHFNHPPKLNPNEMSDYQKKALEEALSKVKVVGKNQFEIPVKTHNGEVTETKVVDQEGLARYLKLQTTMLKGSEEATTGSKLDTAA